MTYSPALATLLCPLGRAAIDPKRRRRPLGAVRVRLGFPSPAEDFEDATIDLNELLVRNEPATFFWRAAGSSMRLAGIMDGDILAVDRSLRPRDGDLVLAIWDGNEPTCKYLHVAHDHVELHAADPDLAPIMLPPTIALEAFVVTGVVRVMQRSRHVRTR